MNTYRVEATVAEDGGLTLTGLPFRPGAVVEVTVLETVGRKGGFTGEEALMEGEPVGHLGPRDEDECEGLR